MAKRFKLAQFEIQTYTYDQDGDLQFVALDLIGDVYCGSGYVPNALTWKGGGIWRDSPIAEGREMAGAFWDNISDALDLTIRGQNPDDCMRNVHRLFELLQLSTDYYAGVNDQPVWLAVRGRGQTNAQYAILYGWSLPRHVNPYKPPLVLDGSGASESQDLPFSFEHGPWRNYRPVDQGDCVPSAGYSETCSHYHVEFNGSNTQIVVPDNAVIQDLADNAFTIEAWVRADSVGELNRGYVIGKDNNASVGWRMRLSGRGLRGQIFCAVTSAESVSEIDVFPYTGEWRHVAMTWDDSTDRFPHLWIDGEYQTNGVESERSGAVLSDVGQTLIIGNRADNGAGFDGGIAWTRVSDVVRYNRRFTPPERCRLPEIDASTVGQWIGVDYSGAGSGTIVNQEGTAAIDGTLSNGSFRCDCEHLQGNIAQCAPSYVSAYAQPGQGIVVLDDAVLQDLGDDAFTCEFWVRVWEHATNNSCLISKGNLYNSGWNVTLRVSQQVRAEVVCAVTDGATYAPNFTMSFGEWHHVAVCWDDASYQAPTIFVDGLNVGIVLANRNGAIVSDVGDDLTMLARSDGNRAANADLGWVMISDVVKYTTDFNDAIPARCTLPTKDSNTVWLGIHEGFGVEVSDLSENANNGTIDNLTWGCECCSDVAEQIAYVRTKNSFVVCDGQDTLINYGDPTHLQDLHDAAFTVDAWIRTNGWGENNAGTIIQKGWNTNVGWRFHVSSVEGLAATIECATANGRAWSGTVAFTTDSAWHHVAFTWDDAASTNPRLWIDGVEQTNNTQVRNGAIATDVGVDLTIANRANATTTFDGDIAWVRVTKAIRWTSNFTPPDRCLPWWQLYDRDYLTLVLLTIFDDHGEVAFDNSYYKNHGLIENGTWGSDCDPVFALTCDPALGAPITLDPLCEDMGVFVGNRWSPAQITHIYSYTWDGGAWVYGPNLANLSGPYPLLERLVAGSGSYILFGIEDVGPSFGPFYSLVFNLTQTAIASAGTWARSNGVGGWTNFSRVQDNTNQDGAMTGHALDTLGRNSVHWRGEGAGVWVKDTHNGVTALWVRLYLNPGAVSPLQIPWNDGPIYAVEWPWTEIGHNEIGGNIPALSETRLGGASDYATDANIEHEATRVLMGLRSLWRGEDFTAWINLGGATLPPGWSLVGIGFGLSTTTNDTKSAGNTTWYAPATSSGTITYSIDREQARHWLGRFHMYARVYQDYGSGGECYLRCRWRANGVTTQTENIYPENLQDYEFLDLGEIVIGAPDVVLSTEVAAQTELDVTIVNTGSPGNFFVYDLLVLPVDEWSADVEDADSEKTALGWGGIEQYRRLLQVDGTRRTKRKRAILRGSATDYIDSTWALQSAGRPILQQDQRQRMYFAFARHYDDGDTFVAPPSIACDVQQWAIQRYSFLRGDQ